MQPLLDIHGPPLKASFHRRPTEDVARDLLGRVVVSTVDGLPTAGRIVETEAYLGPPVYDPGSHSRNGPTPRSGTLFGPVGQAYVYVCYGIHQMLNAVAYDPDTHDAGGVLIRALEPLQGHEHMARRRAVPEDAAHRLCRGPGQLTQALGIERAQHNEHDLTRDPLWLAEGDPVPDDAIEVSGRIGLSEGGELPLRFTVRDSRWVSG